MTWDGLHIGYVPYTNDLTYPGDRRRFCHYAKVRNVQFEIANPAKTYDLVVLTERADLSVWSRYSHGRVVYNLINSYLSLPYYDPKAIARGLAKFVTGQSRWPRLNYWAAIRNMCQRADAVICTTEEQRSSIRPFCNNTHIILDIQPEAWAVKTDFSTGTTFNLVWEGLPENVKEFEAMRPVLKCVAAKHALALHLVTDLSQYQFMQKFVKRNTETVAAKMFDRVFLYQWNEPLFAKIITACDLAVIPLNLRNPLALGKPENKLLLFWRMAMPAVVSASPAYSRAMKESGVNLSCETEEQWIDTIESCIESESARRDAGQSGYEFVNRNYNENTILQQWDQVFESVLNR